jgi:hypothetical protein
MKREVHGNAELKTLLARYRRTEVSSLVNIEDVGQPQISEYECHFFAGIRRR